MRDFTNRLKRFGLLKRLGLMQLWLGALGALLVFSQPAQAANPF